MGFPNAASKEQQSQEAARSKNLAKDNFQKLIKFLDNNLVSAQEKDREGRLHFVIMARMFDLDKSATEKKYKDIFDEFRREYCTLSK